VARSGVSRVVVIMVSVSNEVRPVLGLPPP
jgi:hypothetical protein